MSFAPSKPWRWGLRARIVICTSAVLGLTLAAAFGWSAYHLRAVLQDRNDAFLRTELGEFRASAAASSGDPRGEGLLASLQLVAKSASEEGFYVLLERDGATEALTGSAETAEFKRVRGRSVLDAQPQTVDLPGVPAGVRAIAAPLAVEGSSPWTIILGLPLTDTVRTLANFNGRLAVGSALFLVVAVLGGLLLTRQAIQPVAESIAAARRLNPADLSARLPRTGVGDELDLLAATVNDLLDRLAGYHSQIIQFTADASHELRGPLAAMQAAIEIALHRSRSTADYREVLSSLGEQSHRLIDLVNDLLLLAKADTGQIELQRTPVDLAEVVSEAIETYGPLAEEKGVSLDWYGSQRLICPGDRVRLMQLTMNLIDNAIKFTPAGGSVRAHLAAAGGAAVLTIEDTGIGISADRLPRIFERFYQVDESRSDGGTGLGLSICRWVAAAHGGTIDAVSQPGRGTRMDVTLPGAACTGTRILPDPVRRAAHPSANGGDDSASLETQPNAAPGS